MSFIWQLVMLAVTGFIAGVGFWYAARIVRGRGQA